EAAKEQRESPGLTRSPRGSRGDPRPLSRSPALPPSRRPRPPAPRRPLPVAPASAVGPALRVRRRELRLRRPGRGRNRPALRQRRLHERPLGFLTAPAVGPLAPAAL